MNDYLERFMIMVNELMADSRVRVTHFWAGAAVSEAEIKRVEEALGYALDDSIKAFYRQANGLQLRWLDTGSEFYIAGRDDSTITEHTDYVQGDNDEANGLINILPLAECLVDRSYKEMLYFDWMNDDDKSEFCGKPCGLLTFSKGLRPLDDFSFYNSMAFFLGDNEANPKIVMGDDHNACWTDSRTTHLTSYLELILQNRGGVQARRDVYGQYAGHREVPVVTESAPPTPLDSILPERAQVSATEVADGLRVIFGDEHGGKTRGTVLGRLEGTSSPDYWSYNREFLHVAADGGGEVLIPFKKAAKLEANDAYESARANPDAFFKKLMSSTPLERFETMASVGINSFSYFGQSLTEHAEGSAEDVEFTIPERASRYTALLAGLTAELAVEALVTMIEGWLDDETNYGPSFPIEGPRYNPDDYRGDSGRYEDVIELAFSALALVVCRAYNEAAFDSIRARFDDRTADRIAALSKRLEQLPINQGASDYSNTAFLLRAVEAMPGTIETSLSHGYRGSQFGLVDLPVASN